MISRLFRERLCFSQAGTFIQGGGGGGMPIETVTGNSGGAVAPDAMNNINTVGAGSITIVGNPGTNTLTTELTGLTNHSLQVGGSGTTLTQLGVATNGQLPIGSTGADPVLATLTAGTNISITNGAGSITVAASGAVASSFPADSGTGTPAAGVLDIFGDGHNITTTGSGHQVVVGLTGLTQHDVLVGGASNAITSITNGTTGQLFTASTGADPSWQNAPASSISITGDSGGAQTGNAFTFMGGTTGLTFAGAADTETLGGTLIVGNGGTGATTLTSHGVLLGNTTSAITATSAGTTGQVLTGVTGSAPTFQSPAASSITITGDSGGGLTGNSFTFTGGSTGLTFAGAGTTETLGGTLAIAHGGTNATSMATTDGVVYYDGTRLVTTAVGTAAQVLTSNGAGVAPTFQAAGGTAFDSITVQVFTSSGTYTPTSGMQYCTIEVVGGGGGGGGASTTSTNISLGGGGGGGGYARKTVASATIGASQTVTIGAAGTAGAAGNNAGGTGGTTSVGSIVSATGGIGGAGCGVPAGATFFVTFASGGAAGAGSSGDFNATGGVGGTSFGIYIVSNSLAGISGAGGNSIFGQGALSVGQQGNGTGTGAAGVVYGGGGSGGVTASGTQQAGGAGAAGIVVITEYIH